MKRVGSSQGGQQEIIMMVEVGADVIAEIRNALQIIQGNAELIAVNRSYLNNRTNTILKQVKRIDSLLPQVKFEG